MDELIAADAELELVASGLGFTEGPVWHEDGYLLFADVPRSQILRWDECDGTQVWLEPSEIANGMSRDPQGRLLSCEQSTSYLTRYEHDGTRTIVASHFQGKELNSPNDVICRSDGCIYFTDPPGGRSEPHGRTRPLPRELDFQGVFLLRPDADELELLVEGMFLPNGLCLSVDESILYINDTFRMEIIACDVHADGSVSGERLFFRYPSAPDDPLALAAEVSHEMHETGEVSSGLPDGMKADARGNLYCGGPGGLWVISPDGEHLGVINVPRFVGNLTWGDADWRSLFICASDRVYRLRTIVEGAPPAYPRG